MTQPQRTEQAQASESRAQAHGEGEFALPTTTVPSYVGQRALAQPRALTSMDVLALQRSIGNRETARLLAPMRQPTPLQDGAQAEKEVTPVAPLQISSAKPLIQRVWATVQGQDTKLNLRKLPGETYRGQPVYVDSRTEIQYVRVSRLSRGVELVVKAVPTKKPIAKNPPKPTMGKSKAKRHEKLKKIGKEKKHQLIMQKRRFEPSPDYTNFIETLHDYQKHPKKKIEETPDEEYEQDYVEGQPFDDIEEVEEKKIIPLNNSEDDQDEDQVEYMVEDKKDVRYDDSSDENDENSEHSEDSSEDSDDERLRITEEREEKGVFLNLYTDKEGNKTGKQPIVLLISFNLEKYGLSTITKTADIAQVVRDAVGKIVDIYHPTVLAFQEVTNAKIFIDGMTYQRKEDVQGIKDLNLMELNFDTKTEYEGWRKEYKKEHGQDKMKEVSEKFKLKNTYGIDPGPSFESEKGGNPESYPLIYDEAKVINKPTYFIWKKNKLVPAPKPMWINLSPDDDEEQTPRPVVYAKLDVSTSETGLRDDDDSITMYVGIIHTSPSMKRFATYVDGIRKEYEKVKAYVEKSGATALLLGDVYAEKSAKTFLNNINKSTSLTSMLPEYESNMTLKKAKKGKKRTVQLNQRADMAVVPSYLQPLDKARNLLPPDLMPFSMDEHHEESKIRDKEKGAQKNKLDTKYREGIKTWRDINIDHTPVLVPLEVVLDENGDIERIID